MDNNLRSIVINTLCGKCCNVCFSNYRKSDVIKQISDIGDRFKPSFSNIIEDELVVNAFNYISKHLDYTRDRIAIYKQRDSVLTYIIDIICNNCGYIRSIEVPI